MDEQRYNFILAAEGRDEHDTQAEAVHFKLSRLITREIYRAAYWAGVGLVFRAKAQLEGD